MGFDGQCALHINMMTMGICPQKEMMATRLFLSQVNGQCAHQMNMMVMGIPPKKEKIGERPYLSKVIFLAGLSPIPSGGLIEFRYLDNFFESYISESYVRFFPH